MTKIGGKIFNVNEPTNKLLKFLKENRYKTIISMRVCRIPVRPILLKILNAITLGKLTKNQERLNYDDLFHLYLEFTLEDGSSWLTEKNEVVEIFASNEISYKDAECKDIPVYQLMNPGSLLGRGIKYYEKYYFPKNGIGFYSYDGIEANCQVYVNSLLKGSGLKYSDFVIQNLDTLLPDYAKKLVGNLADFYAGLKKYLIGY